MSVDGISATRLRWSWVTASPGLSMIQRIPGMAVESTVTVRPITSRQKASARSRSVTGIEWKEIWLIVDMSVTPS